MLPLSLPKYWDSNLNPLLEKKYVREKLYVPTVCLLTVSSMLDFKTAGVSGQILEVGKVTICVKGTGILLIYLMEKSLQTCAQ